MNKEDYKAVGAIKNQWIETKDEYLDMALNVIDNLKIKNKQLEEKYEELQEAFKKAITTEHHKIHALLDIIDETKTAVDYMIGNVDISEIHGTKLKQILDKVSDSNE